MGAPRSAPLQRRYAAALIVLVAVAASVAGFGNEFVQDDVPIIAEDVRLHDMTQWPRLLAEPYWPPPYAPDQYRPLTSLLLSVQFIAGAGAPVAVRLASYLLYALTALLVWRLARVVLPGRDTVALAAGALFAAHPVHVEATALGVAQAELVMTSFIVLAVLRYLRLRRAGERGARPWVVLAALYVGAATAKEQGLLLPLFLAATELLLVHEPQPNRRRLAAGFGALAFLGAVLIAIRVAVLGGLAPVNVAETLLDAPFRVRVLTALHLVPHWLRLLAWPAHLRMDYSPQEFVASATMGVQGLMGMAIVVAAGALAWAARRRAPVVSFGLAWTVIALAPVSNVIVATGVLIAERTLLLPSVGAVLAVGAAAAWVPATRVRRGGRRAAAALVAATVLAGVARSADRQRTWRNEDTLTLAAIEDSPRSWRANLNYADLLYRRGDRARSFARYERAIDLAPAAWQVRHAYARRLLAAGDEQQALLQLGLSLEEEPANVDATRDIITTLIALGRYDEARDIAMQALVRGERSAELVRLGGLADSAARVRAPAGSIRVGVDTAGGARALRPRP